jgi:hypothetical protein
MKFHELIEKKIINEEFSEENLEFNLCRFIADSGADVSVRSAQNHFGKIKSKNYTQKFLELLILRKFKTDHLNIYLTEDQNQNFIAAKEIIHNANNTIFSIKIIDDISSNLEGAYINKVIFLEKVVLTKIYFDNSKEMSGLFKSKIFNLLNNFSNYYIQLDKLINSIDENYESENLDSVLYFENNLKLLNQLGVFKLSDLKSKNIDALLCLLFDEIEIFITNLSIYRESLVDDLIITLDQLKEKLETRHWEILLLRNGNSSIKALTLDEIGKAKGVTRERIRQIEKKAIEKMKVLYFQKENDFNSFLFFLSSKNDFLYTSEEQVNSKLINHNHRILFRILMASFPKYYKFSENFLSYYPFLKTSENNLKNNFLEQFGTFIWNDKYSSLNVFEKNIIKELYNVSNTGWLRKGVSTKDTIMNIMTNEFNDGYRISSVLDYEKLKQSFFNIYGLDFLNKFPSKRSLVGFIDRSNYIQIDRGTYRDAKLSPSLDNKLIEKILIFLKNSKEVVYYRTLFGEFQNELNESGITNHYHLKGVIDPYLERKFDYGRDYIKTRPFQSSPLNSIRNMIHQEKKSFLLSQIQEKFPGVKSYVFWNLLYEEEDSNGLIRINQNEFMYAKRMNIDKKNLTLLKEFIDNQLTDNNMVITSRKIYGKLYYEQPDLLEKLHFIKNQFGLFSLIKNFFGDDYFFRRPKLAKSKETLDEPLKIHVLGLKEFDKKTVEDFLNDRGLRSLYSYLDFMEEMSDDFVQVSKDKMIRKDILNISDNDINKIENILNGLIKFKPAIEEGLIKNFSYFPKLNILWDYYLLIGIIRSYFDDKFEVMNEGTMYDKVKFTFKKR